MDRFLTAAAVTSLVLNGTGMAYALSNRRGALIRKAINAWKRRANELRAFATKCYIDQAGCTDLAASYERKIALVDSLATALVDARADEHEFRTESLAIRDAADATLLAAQRDRAAGEQARTAAQAALDAAEQVRTDTLAILKEINKTALDAPEYNLPAPGWWQQLDSQSRRELDNLFPPTRDRIVIQDPEDGYLRVRVPDRCEELVEIPADRVPAWLLQLAPGSVVYADVSVASNPDSAYVFGAWEQPNTDSAPAEECVWMGDSSADIAVGSDLVVVGADA